MVLRRSAVCCISLAAASACTLLTDLDGFEGDAPMVREIRRDKAAREHAAEQLRAEHSERARQILSDPAADESERDWACSVLAEGS